MFMSTLSPHYHGGGTMNLSAEVKMHPDSGSLKKKRVKVTGVASVGSLSCARHCEGSVTVRSHSHLFSTIIHAV